MADTVFDILTIIRESQNIERGWKTILDLCRRDSPSKAWDKLPAPDFGGDVKRAGEWFNAQIAGARIQPRGIYLGLDTLNMEARPRYAAPKNVEIGFSTDANPKILDMDWMYRCDVRGESHLIESLVSMKRVYQGTDISSFADYRAFLGYSGLILVAAVEQAKMDHDFLTVWGFHDGDIFFFTRQLNGKRERLIRL